MNNYDHLGNKRSKAVDQFNFVNGYDRAVSASDNVPVYTENAKRNYTALFYNRTIKLRAITNE